MKQETKITVSIILAAFAFGLQITGIVPVMGIMTEKYAEYGTNMIRFLQTIPYLLTITGSLIVGMLTNRYGEKKVLISGLCIIGICGVLPFFSDDFAVMVLSRLLIGFGFGIAISMNTSIVSRFFEPEKRAQYMGFHVVGMGIGTMGGNLIGGFLASIHFQAFFLVYLIAIFVAGGIFLCLPKTEPVGKIKAKKQGFDFSFGSMIWVLCIATFMHTLFINAYNTNISIYILQYITKNTSVTGIVTAVNAAFALGIGLIFGKISKIFKNFTLPVSIICAGCGYFSILYIPGIAGAYIASALCGISLSGFQAICSFLITISVEQEKVAQASGIFSIWGSIGGLITPFVLGNAASLIGENSVRNQFLIAAIGMIVLAVVMLFIVTRKSPETIND